MRIYGAHVYHIHTVCTCFPSSSAVKNPPAVGAMGDVDSALGSGRPPGGGPGNPLQCSCLENPMDRGAWWATVHGVAKSQTRLKGLQHTCTWSHIHVKVKVKSPSCVRLLVTPWTCSLPGSSIHGIFKARVLEWVVVYTYTMEHYSTIEKNEILPFSNNRDRPRGYHAQ